MNESKGVEAMSADIKYADFKSLSGLKQEL